VAARIITATALRAKTTALAVVKLSRNVGFTFDAVFAQHSLSIAW
jgi:type VI protein secretion system component VasK